MALTPCSRVMWWQAARSQDTTGRSARRKARTLVSGEGRGPQVTARRPGRPTRNVELEIANDKDKAQRPPPATRLPSGATRRLPCEYVLERLRNVRG